ncbi:hypothetical protein R1flu_011918 [Riccia fluitans]|uniref:WRC domain-containing protein n=1 Tax=Riccia fluitans TaxID=41844 RepID=A0ABD1Z958_9MARC
MRIRKHRSSSRVIPEFCITYALEQARNIETLEATKIECPLLQPPTRITGKLPVDDKKQVRHLDVRSVHTSLDSESSSIRIRDFVLAHRGENGRTDGSTKRSFSSETLQHGSELDAGHATASTERTAKGKVKEKTQRSPSSFQFTEKVKSDARWKPPGETGEFGTLVKSEKILNPHSKLTTTRVWETGCTKNDAVSRKRQRTSKMESDSSLAQEKGSATKTKSRGEEDCAAGRSKDAMAISEKKKARKLAADKEGLEGSSERIRDKLPVQAAFSFPAGWSYRGLAQIAEHDKPSQGKQCGRTDGRSWRCPLKVQEGFTLCEHHLSKFRLKKLSKESRKQKAQLCRPRPQRQQQPAAIMVHHEQQRRQLEHEVEEEFEEEKEEETAADSSLLPAVDEIAGTAQTPPTVDEQDSPTRFRRRHKTVKLSGL